MSEKITLENLLAKLRSDFESNNVIKVIDIYNNSLVFLSLKTDLLNVGIDCKVDGTIELVFRDSETQKNFSIYFEYPFSKKAVIFDKGISNHPNFESPYLSPLITLSDISDRVMFIIKRCLRIEKSTALRISTLFQKYRETVEDRTLKDLMLDMSDHMQPRLLSILDTVKRIRDEKLSIARFGDGEIRAMVTKEGGNFQTHNWKLLRELREVSSSKSDLLVCYPSLIVEEPWWHNFWYRYWARCKFYITKDIYGDSFITRPEGFYQYGEELINAWKDIWTNKNVCFVTGEGSRLNANHIIFSTIKDSLHIYSKAVNAYEDIDNVMEKCMAVKGVDMFLIALGETGTVLAYRLHKLGYRALDIGHLNNSYDTVFNNKPLPEHLPKYTSL